MTWWILFAALLVAASVSLWRSATWRAWLGQAAVRAGRGIRDFLDIVWDVLQEPREGVPLIVSLPFYVVVGAILWSFVQSVVKS